MQERISRSKELGLMLKKLIDQNRTGASDDSLKKDSELLMLQLQTFNQQLEKKQYVEVVPEHAVEDRQKKHHDIVTEVFGTSDR